MIRTMAGCASLGKGNYRIHNPGITMRCNLSKRTPHLCELKGANKRRVLLKVFDRRACFCSVLWENQWMRKSKASMPWEFKIGKEARPLSILSGSEQTVIAALSEETSELDETKQQDDVLQRSIAYEAHHGFSNSKGRTTRFADFLFLKLSTMNQANNLSGNNFSISVLANIAKGYDGMGYHDRMCLLNQVSQIFGFGSVHDLVAYSNHLISEANQSMGALKLGNAAHAKEKQSKDYTASLEVSYRLAQKSYSSVIFGNSDRVVLFDYEVAMEPESTFEVDTSIETTGSQRVSTEHEVGHETHVNTGIGVCQPIEDIADQSMSNGYGEEIGQGFQGTQESESHLSVADADEDVSLRDDANEGVSLHDGANEDVSLHVDANEDVSLHVDARRELSRHIEGDVRFTDKGLRLKAKVEKAAKKVIVPDKANEAMGRMSVFVSSTEHQSRFLDRRIALVKSLTPSLRKRLDRSGFNTIHKLLQHFPRTHISFQEAGKVVENGQHLMFFGKIVMSRGFRLGLNVAYIEVLVECAAELDDGDIETDGLNMKEHGNKMHTIFLHLKRFYRGPRFTGLSMLNNIANRKYPVGAFAAVSGKVKLMPNDYHYEITDFHLKLSKDEDSPCLQVNRDKLFPIYSTKIGLESKIIEFCIKKILPELPLDIDPLPYSLRMKYGLMELHEAYRGIHSPPNLAVLDKARQRFVFEEFFYLQLGLLMKRHKLAGSFSSEVFWLETGELKMEKWSPITLKVMQSLPFNLTQSQVKVISEIIWDLRRPIPMRRLLQGEVGSGKTVIALLSLLEIVDAGYQGALMGPTEFLASQLYEKMVSWLGSLEEHERPQIALLTGSVSGSKARVIRKGLESGEIALVVGTHSLISKSVKFASLGLAIIDEQHRFGVVQRLSLQQKGMPTSVAALDHLPDENAGDDQLSDGDSNNDGDASLNANTQEEGNQNMLQLRAPHVLAMTATPIPRTLALVLHGDMTFSQITEMPPGRVPIKTFALLDNQEGLNKLYQLVHNDLESGGRAFFVYPAINESEQLPKLKAVTVEYEKLAKRFQGYNCGLVHGKLSTSEKEESLRLFRCGDTQILVSTTVIEAGIDIPEASMMVVMNAERYGMSQLHQLRGRVGRGMRESTCILLGSSEESLDRLRILEETQDGIYLAEADLRIRGPGELIGKHQSGQIPNFNIARLDSDADMMNEARNAAEEILSEYPGLVDVPNLKQELHLRLPFEPLD